MADQRHHLLAEQSGGIRSAGATGITALAPSSSSFGHFHFTGFLPFDLSRVVLPRPKHRSRFIPTRPPGERLRGTSSRTTKAPFSLEEEAPKLRTRRPPPSRVLCRRPTRSLPGLSALWPWPRCLALAPVLLPQGPPSSEILAPLSLSAHLLT